MIYFLKAYFENKIFEYFRTQEHPLYTIETHSYDQGLQFLLYSSNKSEIELSKDLKKIISQSKRNIGYFDFLKIKNNYVNNDWFNHQPFEVRNKEYWLDIIDSRYNIDYRKKVKAAATSISYSDFKNFYASFLEDEGKKIQLNFYTD